MTQRKKGEYYISSDFIGKCRGSILVPLKIVRFEEIDRPEVEKLLHKANTQPDLLEALMGSEMHEETPVPALYNISWLESLLRLCKKPEVLKILIQNTDNDADAIGTMIMQVEELATKGKAAIAKGGGK